MENENIVLVGEKSVEIKPVKMKYLKQNFYKLFILIKTYGLVKLLNFQDGAEVIDNFLFALLDGDKETIDYVKEELTNESLNEILEKVKQVNELPDEEKN